MMSYIPDDATRQRLLQECQHTFPGLPQNVVLAVLHENRYDLASAYSTLLRFHNDIRRRPSQPNLSTNQSTHSSSINQSPSNPHFRTDQSQQGYAAANPYAANYNNNPGYPYNSASGPRLHHSQSEPAIRHQSYYPGHNPYYQHQYPQNNSPGNFSSNFNQPHAYRTPSSNRPYTANRSPSPSAYPNSSPRPAFNTNTNNAFNTPVKAGPDYYAGQYQANQYPSGASPRQYNNSSPQHNYDPNRQSPRQYENRSPQAYAYGSAQYPGGSDPRQELTIDVSGNAGRHYQNIEQGSLMPARVHSPQQCTDPHNASAYGPSPVQFSIDATSPIDARVPHLPFPLQPPSPHDSPRLAGAAGQDGRPRTGSQEETAYKNALILQQRARMSKLHKHLMERKKKLDLLSKEVLDKETRLLRRNNEQVRPVEAMAKLAESNRKLQVQNQLMTQEIDHYQSGDAPLGVLNPRSADNFHQSITGSGQAGPMRLPDTAGAVPAAADQDLSEFDEGEQWDCATCTFKNHPALNECECCLVPRHSRLPTT